MISCTLVYSSDISAAEDAHAEGDGFKSQYCTEGMWMEEDKPAAQTAPDRQGLAPPPQRTSETGRPGRLPLDLRGRRVRVARGMRTLGRSRPSDQI